MTYCLGVAVDDGLLMLADTRTNAGVDNVSCYRKLHTLCDTRDRQIHLACSGSLSVSQSVLNRIDRERIAAAKTLFDVAEAVGAVLHDCNVQLSAALGEEKCGASFLVGGRIGAEQPRLFHLYREGNFIECTPDLPYLQIGETKYGRPILDRVITRRTPLAAAVKIAFLSFDSAMRSNLSIARPLDLMILPNVPGQCAQLLRIEQDDVYFNELSRRWSSALLAATEQMPDPYFMDEGRSCVLPRQMGALRAL